MFKLIAIVPTLVAVLALALGRDLRPWVRAARQGAKAELEQLVSAHRLYLAKAEQAVEDARRRAQEAERSLAASKAAVRRLEGELVEARSELGVEQRKLEVLKAEVQSNTVAAPAGNPPEQRIRDQELRRNLAAERVALVEDVLRRHRDRVATLEPVVREAPGELERLGLSVRHLREKVKLLDELKELQGDTGERTEVFAEARQALQDAHADVDVKLRAVDARLAVSGEPADAGQVDREAVSTR